MQLVGCYNKCSKISEVKLRYLLRLFALDLTASDAARLTGLSGRSVNEVSLRLRRRGQTRCPTWCPVPAELNGAVERDESYFGESYFGPRRVRGKRGRGAGGKTIIFGLFKRGGQVYTEIVPGCSKKTLQARNQARAAPRLLLLKIAPDLTDSQFDDILKIARETNLSRLVATNTTISRDNLSTEPSYVASPDAGGLSRRPLRARATEVTRYLH